MRRRSIGLRWSAPRMCMRGLVALVVVLAVTTARADDLPEAEPTHPVLSADDGWVRPMLYGVAGLFAAAAVVGPVVRLRARHTVPPAATHEDDAAADRH